MKNCKLNKQDRALGLLFIGITFILIAGAAYYSIHGTFWAMVAMIGFALLFILSDLVSPQKPAFNWFLEKDFWDPPNIAYTVRSLQDQIEVFAVMINMIVGGLIASIAIIVFKTRSITGSGLISFAFSLFTVLLAVIALREITMRVMKIKIQEFHATEDGLRTE